jgi:hypothetical protein
MLLSIDEKGHDLQIISEEPKADEVHPLPGFAVNFV